jgi:hypothetical protein
MSCAQVVLAMNVPWDASMFLFTYNFGDEVIE